MKRACAWLAIVLIGVAMGCANKRGDQGDGGAAADSTGGVTARPGMTPVPSDSLPRGPWMWVATVTPVERIAPADPAQYTIEFLPDSTARLLLFCNRGSGSYHVQGKSLRIGPIAATRMMCPSPTLDAEFGQHLDAVRGWFMLGDTLMLDLFADSGTMRFAR